MSARVSSCRRERCPPLPLQYYCGTSPDTLVYYISLSGVSNLVMGGSTSFKLSEHHKRPRSLLDISAAILIPGGNLIPAPDTLTPFFTLASITSTRALARAIAGTTQVPQLQRMPCHANLPILEAQLAFGQVRRPEMGASGVREGSPE